MMFMMFALWALVIIGVVALIRSGEAGASERETPFQILRRRYATGELTREQFEEMKGNVA